MTMVAHKKWSVPEFCWALWKLLMFSRFEARVSWLTTISASLDKCCAVSRTTI
jgi:hypothetical protein